MNALQVSPSDYHSRLKVDRGNIFSKDSWLSKSVLWQLKSKSLFQWRYHPQEFKPTAAMQWGSLVDCLLTTPEELDEVIALHDFKDFRTKEAREFRDSALASGKIVVDAKQMAEGQKAREQVLKNKDARKVVEESLSQVVVMAKIRDVQFKGLVDFVPKNSPYLVDFKTTSSFTPKGIASAVGDYGYHVQAYLYNKLYNEMMGEERNRFRFIWQMSTPPYEVAVTELASVDISSGGEYANFLFSKLVRAAKADKWPNIFDDKIAMISRPNYAMYQEEEEMEGIFDAPGDKKEVIA